MNIHYYLPVLDNPFWKEVVGGVKAESANLHHYIKTISANDDSGIQLGQLQAYAQENPDAILVSPIQADKITGICKEIMSRNIPIVSIDQHMIGFVHSSVMSGNLTGGIGAAKYIGDHMKTGSGVVLIKAPQGYENIALRRKSFVNECKRLNLQIIREIEGEFDRATVRKRMEGFLDERAGFAAVFAENDVMALGVVDAVMARAISPRPLIVGYDGIPEARECILNRQMDATVQQNPAEMGKKAVSILNKIKKGLDYEETVSISTHMLTIDTLK
ncbi:sugar ABC transporter substrate-binding protein [bacterium]|nr:sugar ABC transporter substrate-binding protein [bacterium]